jgi:hypothetical protein
MMISDADIIREFARHGLTPPPQLLGPAYKPFWLDARLAHVELQNCIIWIDENRERLMKEHKERERRRVSKLIEAGNPYDPRTAVRPSKLVSSASTRPSAPTPSAAPPASTSVKADNKRPRQRSVAEPSEPTTGRWSSPKAPRANQYIVELTPTPEQAERLEDLGYAVDIMAWDVALDYTIETYKATGMFVDSASKLTKNVRARVPECRAAPYESIHNVCNEVYVAVRNYTARHNGPKPVPFPAFREWTPGGGYLSVTHVVIDLDRSRIKFPKLGWIAVHNLVDTIGSKQVKRAKLTQHPRGSRWNSILIT